MQAAIKKAGFISLFLLVFICLSYGQRPDSIATVMLSVTLDAEKPSIQLSWDHEFTPSSYQISRRPAYVGNFTVLANLGPSIDQYTDTAVQSGVLYEYRVIRNTPSGQGSGFIMAGIDVPEKIYMGRMLIVIPESLLSEIRPVLEEYIDALEMDGWTADILPVSPQETVVQIKNKIKAYHDNHRIDHRAVFLLGNVPVPYSGNMAPDGHVPDHQGAWPSDGFYAELDGFWTDFDVEESQAARPENRNTPGDGKYDQNQFPSNLELEIGRADFSRLPALNKTEQELTENYLRKNIAFRRGEIPTQYRGIIQNNFSSFQEGFGQSGLKNFTHLLGKEQTAYGNYREKLLQEPYLWSYGCGPGSYTSAAGIINTANLATDSLQTVFTMLFGSYFGDWDVPNNLLRAVLASGTVLTNAWSGRPVWMFHHMGMGETIGFSARKTMNNILGEYGGSFQRFTHTALMGDPSLTMYPIGPVSELTAEEADSCITLSWNYPENIVKSFHVFRRDKNSPVFTRMTEQALEENTFCISCPEPGKEYEYQVREIRKIQSVSGTFFQLGHGKKIAVIATGTPVPMAAARAQASDLEVTFTLQSENASRYWWDFGDGQVSSEENPVHTYTAPGEYSVTHVASNSCFSDTTTLIVSLMANATGRHHEAAECQITPNPFQQEIHMAFSRPTFVHSVNVINLLGERVFYRKMDVQVTHEKISLPPSLPPGAYVIQIDVNGQRISRKLVKN
jgi:hypothetical protein